LYIFPFFGTTYQGKSGNPVRGCDLEVTFGGENLLWKIFYGAIKDLSACAAARLGTNQTKII
jgi:hypothetical protein